MSPYLILLVAQGTYLSAQDPQVTFSAKAARVENIFPELTKVVGKNLLWSPQTKDEILVIHVANISSETLMTAIAKAASAEWREETGAWRLVRTPKLLKELQEKRAQQVEKQYKFLQANLAQRLETAGEFTSQRAALAASKLEFSYDNAKSGASNREEDYRFAKSIETLLPGWRLAAELGSQLPANILAQASVDRPIVFSNKPNRLQLPLPKGTDAKIKAFEREAQTLVTHLKRSMPMVAGGIEDNVWNAINLRTMEDLAPDIVHFKFRYTGPGATANGTLLVANSKGRIICRTEIQFNDKNDMATEFNLPIDEKTDLPMDLQPLSLAWLRRLNGSPAESVEPKLGLQDYLTDYLHHEIAELIYSEFLLGLAAASKKNLVAFTPQGNGWISKFGASSRMPTPSGFLKSLQAGYYPPEISLSDSLLLIAPRDWIEEQRFYVNAAAKSKFLLSCRNGLEFEQLVELCSYAPTSEAVGALLRFVRYLVPNADFSGGGHQFEPLRFYGMLTRSQRERSFERQGIPWKELTPTQKHAAENMILSENTFKPITLSDQRIEAGTEHVWPNQSIYYQPTELYKHGIPDTTLFKIESHAEPTKGTSDSSSFSNRPNLWRFEFRTSDNTFHTALVKVPQ